MDDIAETKNSKSTASNKDIKPPFFYGYLIVGFAFLTVMAQFGSQYSFGIFFKPMLDEFGWSRALTSGAYSVNLILQGLFMVLAGRLCDRFGPRIVVTVSGLLLGLGYCLMSQISSVWQIYLFYGVFISMGSITWVPLLSTTARWFIKRRGLMSGIISAGIGFGLVIFPPVSTLLIGNYGWRLSFIIVGLSAAVIYIISAQFLKRDPSQKGQLAYGSNVTGDKKPDTDTQGFSLKEAIRTWQFWIICVAFFASNFCSQIIIVHIVPHATDIGILAAAAATIVSAIGILSIGSKIGVGAAIDRLGGKPILISIPIFMSISFLWLIFINQLWMFYLFAIVYACGYGASSAIQGPIIAEHFGLKSHGTIMGALLVGNTTGGAVGPLLAGRIFDTSGSYRWAFIICIIISLTVLLVVLLLKPTRQKEVLSTEV